MLDILIVNKNNSFGLTRDTSLLTEALTSIAPAKEIGVKNIRERSVIQRLMRRQEADTIIHVERAFPRWYSAAKWNLLCPNQERFPRRHLSRLKGIDLVLAKSHHALEIFRAQGVEAVYTGFTSEDRHDPAIQKNWQGFMHLAGGSTLKGTEDLLALWRRHPEWPELTLVQKEPDPATLSVSNIRVASGYISDAELKCLQNTCGIHLCPSRSEGWGHHLVEAMSVGAVVVSTDGPPMNEHLTAESGVLVPYAKTEPRHLGTNYFFDIDAMEVVIEQLLQMDDTEKQRLENAARHRFLEIDTGFRTRLAEAIAPFSYSYSYS